MKNSLCRTLGFGALLTLVSFPAWSRDEVVAAGREIAEANCSRCHAVGRSGVSPRKESPPFRTLHERYPVDSLAEALAEGIIVGHPDMPRFVLDPMQIEAFIAYLKSLEIRK